MKKKRLIKLLMGYGVSRNTSAIAAEAAAIAPISKGDFFLNFLEVRSLYIDNPITAPLIEPALLAAAKNIIAAGGTENA
jgi:hypothetical protein